MAEARLRWVITIPQGAGLPPDIADHVRALNADYSDDVQAVVTYDPHVRWDAVGNTRHVGSLLRAVPREWVTERPSEQEVAEALTLLYDIVASWEHWLGREAQEP